MSRELTRTFGVLTMMVTMLMGMNGRLEAGAFAPAGAMCVAGAAQAAPPTAHSTRDVVYQMADGGDGSIVVTAVSSEIVFRKAVFPDGRVEAAFERGRDRVSVVTTANGVTVSRGASVITLENTSVSEESLGRVRGLFASSPALRAFRALDAAVEDEDELTSPERLAVRLTGALVAQLDGDEGAVARLAKQLRAKVTGPARKARAATVDCWSIYVSGTIRAANDLERCYSYYSIWDPRRQACSFVWTLQVEGAWFGYLSCSSVPLK